MKYFLNNQALSGICLLLLTHATAHGHAGERGFIMLMPTTEWIAVGTLVVAATFLLLVFSPSHWFRSLGRQSMALLSWQSAWPQRFAGGLMLLCYLVLIAAGNFGSTDPLINPVGPVMWSWFWVGMVFVHLLFGNVWRLVNPFDIADRMLRSRWPGQANARCCDWLQNWQYLPAVVLLIVVTWFENVSLSPYDPSVLASAMLLYLVLNLLAMRLFGRELWLQYGEVFSVYFRMISWLAPLRWTIGHGGCRVALGWPYLSLLKVERLPLSGTLFVLVALACVTFDGLSHTYFWLGMIGINPLEFGGRSTVYWQNSLGLLLACSILFAAYAVAVGIGDIGRKRQTGQCVSSFHMLAVSLVPIAFGYHLAHYLPAFALESQYALKAVSDPFARGWNLFGTADLDIIASVRSGFGSVTLIWTIQMTAIVVSHVLSVVIAHLIMADAENVTSVSRWRQVPFAVLMIGYTFVGLWLLSTASL